ncbi:MAG: YbjN domain-containing protein [Armatimonadota bacterium]|nr:YbjN domain-containing protein [Armatimonadota bacterium]
MPVQFQTDAQKVVYEKVGQYMKELFGELASARDDVPAYYLWMGSAAVQAFVYAWGDKEAVVNVRSYVVTGAERTPEMLEFLLKENFNMRFGAFGLDKDGDVTFEHNLIGSTCDKNELRTSMMAVLGTADQYDDQIVSRWGGKRAMDRT